MQTYQNKRKAPERASSPAQKTAPTRSEMLHLAGAGAPQPMSPQLREKFEPGFCADFTNIRISRGHIPEEMGVQAVAQGTDILLDESAGMDVLGHELAHVVQQAQGRVEGGFPVVENASLEQEADVMGARVASGLTAQAGPQNGLGGEPMAIAPMSEASAPAQCKSRQEKKKAKKAAQPQQQPLPGSLVSFSEDVSGLLPQAPIQQDDSLADDLDAHDYDYLAHRGPVISGSPANRIQHSSEAEDEEIMAKTISYLTLTDEDPDSWIAPAKKKHWWQR
ncbi:MAG TPA: DUF4157 domain-containing protein [Firmicutes bacterium]|nr:DUF4157 domain-containing protein [Bacillota bacterium]